MLKEEFGEINHRNPKELNNGSPRLSVYLRALRFDKSVVTVPEPSLAVAATSNKVATPLIKGFQVE